MDPHLGRHTRHQLITIALAGLAAYGGSLLAQPSGTTTHPRAVAIESTAANALDVAGGAEFGSGNVPLVGADGTINGPLSSTILSDLSGANLTGLDAGQITSGAFGSARIATNAVGASEIAANAVGASEIAANAVGASEIAANAVGASEIAANAVGAAELRTASANTSGTGTTRITMHEYSFVPSVDISTSNNCDTRDETRLQPYPTTGSTSTSGTFTVRASGQCTVTARWRYITTSDTPSVWAVVDPTGAVVSLWEAEDPISPGDTVAPLVADDPTHRVVNMGVPSLAVLTALAEALPAAQQTAFLTRLDTYVADTRGWHAGVTALADLATIAPRYEPSGRQWAMRLLAEVQGLAEAELYRTALEVDPLTDTWVVAAQ